MLSVPVIGRTCRQRHRYCLIRNRGWRRNNEIMNAQEKFKQKLSVSLAAPKGVRQSEVHKAPSISGFETHKDTR